MLSPGIYTTWRDAPHINALRRKLELPPVQDLATQSTDQQWEAYLDSKPGLRQWAATYKQQAEMLKQC